MTNYTLQHAANLCRRYAENLSQLPNAQDTALECAAMLEEEAKLVPTITENQASHCQALSSFLAVPEIDYTSGFPR